MYVYLELYLSPSTDSRNGSASRGLLYTTYNWVKFNRPSVSRERSSARRPATNWRRPRRCLPSSLLTHSFPSVSSAPCCWCEIRCKSVAERKGDKDKLARLRSARLGSVWVVTRFSGAASRFSSRGAARSPHPFMTRALHSPTPSDTYLGDTFWFSNLEPRCVGAGKTDFLVWLTNKKHLCSEQNVWTFWCGRMEGCDSDPTLYGSCTDSLDFNASCLSTLYSPISIPLFH